MEYFRSRSLPTRFCGDPYRRKGDTWKKTTLQDVQNYLLFCKERDERYDPERPAFRATHCFDEKNGAYTDVTLPYGLYLPEDYNPRGRYGLVLHIHDMASLGDDPRIALTDSLAPRNFASRRAQQIVINQGLDGLIVLVPQVPRELCCCRDNWTLSAAVPATWQLLDYIADRYSIDRDRIYGTGQSMGGMQLLAMAAQRDNYFAGLWLLGCQWGSNYNKNTEYEGAKYFQTEDPTVWRTDDDGRDSDLGRNLYYLLSDDNVLVMTCTGDGFAPLLWRELEHLYREIAGVEIPHVTVDPVLPVEEQNAILKLLLAVDSGPVNFHHLSFQGGSHMETWRFGHKLDAGLNWLLHQTKQSAQKRPKLSALNRPWHAETDPAKVAAKQTDERKIGRLDDKGIFLAVPSRDAGTIGYNSTLYSRGGKEIIRCPGWVEIR